MRLFIAVNFPDSVREAIYGATLTLRRAAPSLGWVRAETLHITLVFLGEVAESKLQSIESALVNAARQGERFALQLRGLGAFPNLRRARVFWLGAAEEPALLRLQARIVEAVSLLGFHAEARPFHAHVTLGRVGRGVSADQLHNAERAVAEVEYETTVDIGSVELMQSRLSQAGARYQVVRSVPLGARN